MGSAVDVRGLGVPSGPDGADVVGRRIDGVLTRLERCWSRFDHRSDLSRLNADPSGEVEVPLLLAAAVRRATLAWGSTGGAFDPTVLDALVAAGYDRTFELVAERSVPAPVGADVPGCALVEVRGDEGADLLRALSTCHTPTAVVRRPAGLHLDLGGIGKGLAADLLASLLVATGTRSVHVSLGGDVRVAGEVPDGGWPVPVTDPWDGSELLSVVLDRPGAVVMSSTRRRRWQTDGGGWAHHLIDPSTGRPAASGVAAVVAVAEEAWWAEALAKAALVLGAEDGVELLRRQGAEGVVVGDDTEQVACWRALSPADR
ncbi:FAD:protein FMN transferase [Dermatobacter hominis]|uniref:FAD:protein FMN transferase n=1 Tax=Dermatobacter hominis TaxID=2884263 RepID=UPI001D112DED|nr:FAD:protein FMN transferase [Dermatobacter hominis]UDY34705.1 FAD:protein FMN transferase [Dermatobacter hominis]